MRGDNAKADELARLLEHYRATLKPPTDDELRSALRGRWPLGMSAKMVSADGLEATEAVPAPPPPKLVRMLKPPRSSMASRYVVPDSSPQTRTRVYELVHVDLELGGCVYQEVIEP